jgi:hypothetical protein
VITLYGIEFPEDEVQVVLINGQPEWTVSIAGARRLAEHAPDPQVRADFLALLDKLDAGR